MKGPIPTTKTNTTSELPTEVKDSKIMYKGHKCDGFTVKSPIYISHKIKIMYHYPSQNMLQAEVSAIKLFYYQQIYFLLKSIVVINLILEKRKTNTKTLSSTTKLSGLLRKHHLTSW